MIVYAVNVHTGGGKILLDEILKNQAWGKVTYAFLDPRYTGLSGENFPIVYSKSRLLGRLTTQVKLYRLLKVQNSKVLFFGNLPPFFRCPTESVLFLQNCFLTRQVPLPKDSFKVFFRTLLESLILKFFAYTVDAIWVQTPWMQKITNKYLPQARVVIHPLLPTFPPALIVEREIDLLYVGSLSLHKRLDFFISSLKVLDSQTDHRLKVVIVLDGEAFPTIAPQFSNIDLEIRSNINRHELYHIYNITKVYVATSLYESFCLPLYEAKHFGCRIVAPTTGYTQAISDIDLYDPFLEQDLATKTLTLLKL